jgi:hypothetical protein
MITQKMLKSKVTYDKDSGLFYNKKTGRRVGFIHSSNKINNTKYIKIAIIIDGKEHRHYAHRLAWLYTYGKFPEFQIDHIDHDGTNNKIHNLRDVAQAQNSKNVKKSSSNTSGYTGVWRRGRMWVSEIMVDRKKIKLGSYKNIQDAVIARMKAEKKYVFHENHGK